MLKRIKNLLERSAITIAIALTFLIIYLSLAQTSDIMTLGVSDKTLHSLAYFGLTSSWFFAIKSSHFRFKAKISIGLLVLLLSVSLEFLQGSLTDYRTADYYDILANAFGIIIAFVSFRTLLQVYQTI